MSMGNVTWLMSLENGSSSDGRSNPAGDQLTGTTCLVSLNTKYEWLIESFIR